MKKLFALLGLLIFTAAHAHAQDMRGTVFRTAAWNDTTSGITSTTLDAANDWVAHVFYAKEAGTLSSLCGYLTSETGTGPTYKLGWEGVDATTGEANATYKTGSGECSCTIATNGLSAGWQCCTPTGTTCTATRGEAVAQTIKHSSGTVDGSNFAVWGTTMSGAFNDSTPLIPNNSYAVANTTGTGTAGSGTKSAEAPMYMYKFTGSRTFGRPITSAGTQNYSSDSASDEYGNKTRFYCPTGATFTVRGIEWYGQTASAAKSATLRLYTGTTAVPGAAVQDVTWDADQETSGAGSNRGFERPFDEVTLSNINCESDFLVTIQVNETSSNFGLRYWDVGDNSDLDAYPGGSNTYAIHRADGTGAFTEVPTRRMGIDILIDDITISSSGGGGGGSVSIMTRDITKDEATAAERRIPLYLVDVTDGTTEETGLTISGSECRISKNGASPANCGGSVVEDENGLYYYQASAGDVDTVGYVTIRIADSAARKFIGVANITGFDFTSTAPNVNVQSASPLALENGDFAPLGTAQAVTASTITLAASASYGDNALRNNAVHIVSADTGAGQTECICSNVGATDVATLCSNWQITPTGATITYNILPRPACDRIITTVTGNVNGNVGGNVTGSVGSVTGNVGGNVVGSTASVTAPVTVGAVNAAGLSDLFDVNSGTTYSGAVAGSVVKEIADNAGAAGSNPTITTGTAQSITGTTTTTAGMRLAASATYGNDVLKNNASVMILTSAGNTAAVGQVMCVKTNAATNDVVTFNRPWKSLPSGIVTYAVIPTPNCNTEVWPVGR